MACSRALSTCLCSSRGRGTPRAASTDRGRAIATPVVRRLALDPADRADTQVGWDLLGELSRVTDFVPIVDRWNMSRAWLADPDGLGLPVSEIWVMEQLNSTIYDWRIHESRDDADLPLDLYLDRLELDELTSPPLSDKRLLLFGSLHGSTRIIASSPAYARVAKAASEAMIFRHPVLLDPVDEIVRRLGGPGGYIALHLRVGDGYFEQMARIRMPEVFHRLMQEVFGFDRARSDELLERSRSLHCSSI